jgi:nucleoid-associated protein YejK
MRKKLDHIHKEKGENLHLKQQLEHNNKIIEQLQKSTKTVYVAKEKPFGLSLISSFAGDMRFRIRKSILDFSSGIVTRCSRASSNQSLIIGSLSFVGLPDSL